MNYFNELVLWLNFPPEVKHFCLSSLKIFAEYRAGNDENTIDHVSLECFKEIIKMNIFSQSVKKLHAVQDINFVLEQLI